MSKRLLIAAALAAVLAGLPAAEARDDWEWWFSTPVSYRPVPEVRLNAEAIFRWKNDMKDIYYRSGIAGGTYSVLPGVAVGGHFWYKESRRDKNSPWVYSETYVANLNLHYRAADWLVLRENNRIEYDNGIYRWILRMRPRLDFPLARWGLKPVTLYLENEFFFKFDFPDGRDTFSENRTTAGASVAVAGPFGISVAYRSRAQKPVSTGRWNNTNVLVTSARLSF